MIEISITCKECKDSLEDGIDDVYCRFCYEDLVDALEEAKEKIRGLEEEIYNLESKMS